jgi:hypothetical protein
VVDESTTARISRTRRPATTAATWP